MGARRVRRTTLICWFCGGLLLGVFVGRQYSLPVFLIVPIALVAFRLRRKHHLLCILLLSLGLIIGVGRGAQIAPELEKYQRYRDVPIVVYATVLSDSGYNDRGQVAFDVSGLVLNNGERLKGKITVSGRGESMIYKGDRVELRGTMRPGRGSRQAYMNYAIIRRVAKSNNPIDSWRRRFSASVFSAIPEPMASFGLGLLVGQRDTLPDDVSDQLSTVGLTHLIAVSGYNLTIITTAVRRLSSRRSKYQTAVLTLLLVGAFLLVTGFSASIVRAAIVSALSLWAWYYGRKVPALLLILVTAAVTALWHPFYVWGDVGWYLSFLAFFGVLIIAPALETRLFWKRHQAPFIVAVAIESLAAQLMTVPLIMYVFGRLSVVSLLANVLAVPVAPYAMLVTFLTGLIGVVEPVYAAVVSGVSHLILGYMLAVAGVLAKVPFAEVRVSISMLGMMAIYGIIVGVTWCLVLHNRLKYDTIPPESSSKTER